MMNAEITQPLVFEFNPLTQENSLTQHIYQTVQQSRNLRLSIKDRANAWKSALDLVTNKQVIAINVNQNTRPSQYNEPLIDNSPVVDGRVLESYCPPLKALVDKGEINTQATYAILEYFLRTGYHGLNANQTIALARQFPPQRPNQSFAEYKTSVDQTNSTKVIPNRTAEESWTMGREIMDLLEITDNIRAKYLQKHAGKRTIFITDLMRISAEALRTVYLASTRLGAAEIRKRDEALLSSSQTPKYRNTGRETTLRALLRPDVLLPMILSPSPRNFSADAESILHLQGKIGIEGTEFIPNSGPVIIAFSHMNRWKDQKVPPNWDMAKLLQEVLRRRSFGSVALVAYVNYFKETAPKPLRAIANKLVDGIASRAQEVYGIQVIDVAAYDQQKVHGFVDQAKGALQNGKAVLISPEGVPVREIVKPKRGVGMLSRLSGAPVVGVAFREEYLSDGSFRHSILFTHPRHYTAHRIPGRSVKEKDQAFSDAIMRDIARQLPQAQRGIFR